MGIVGAGGFAAFLCSAAATLPDVAIIAVTDAQPGRAAELAATYYADTAVDLTGLLADPRIAAVVIATPPHTHAALTLQAVAAGRHVFCEKPVALTTADARRVRDAVVASGTTYLVDHVLRYNPILAGLRRLFGDHLIGSLQRFNSTTTPPTRTSPRTTGSGTTPSAAASSWNTDCTSSTPPPCSSKRRAVCGDWTRAEDLVQTALLRLYLKWPRISLDGVDAYTRRTIVRLVIDESRRPHRRREVSGDLPETATAAGDPDGGMDVRAALLQVPARQRAVLVLRYFNQLSVAETADVLRVT